MTLEPLRVNVQRGRDAGIAASLGCRTVWYRPRCEPGT
jgi:hypothetical protein